LFISCLAEARWTGSLARLRFTPARQPSDATILQTQVGLPSRSSKGEGWCLFFIEMGGLPRMFFINLNQGKQ
jgi:hypothetical protein